MLGLLLLAGCSNPYAWYEHPCGNSDPVGFDCEDAAGYIWEDPSGDLCEDLGVIDGDLCVEGDEACVLTPAFTCASLDPSLRSSEYQMACRNEPYDDEQCPSSSRTVKRDIEYIAPSERKVLAQEVLDVKLARYHYRDPAKPGEKLGFILEDHPNATFSGDGRVDLYAYLSAVVAVTQEQQVEIERLKREIEALKAER
jgi:hypothetical protein